MAQSIKVLPSEPSVMEATANINGPSQKNCLMQLAHIHRLCDSEENYNKHQFEMSMQIARNREGLGVPLKMCMDLYAAKQIGRLPFLQSSNIMEDVLLGRDEIIEFPDFLGVPENSEFLNQPHMVVEKKLGIL